MTVDPVIEEAARRGVLSAWGEQQHPKVLAFNRQQAMYWLTQNDEYLTKCQGSYEPMIVTPHSANRLRGWHGMLIVVRADRMEPPPGWFEALEVASNVPGISLWTEVLPWWRWTPRSRWCRSATSWTGPSWLTTWTRSWS